ncbi:MAG: isocitrate/isopropylmalate dehydrogenase family protein [Candidatus Bathyarchaeia archaeon]
MKIALIEGDGIGPEVVGATLRVLEAIGFEDEFVRVHAGYERWKREGVAITDDDIEILRRCDIVLKGPIITPTERGGFKSVNVEIRKALDLYANVRPAKSLPITRPEYHGLNVIIIRENLEGLYSGRETLEGDVAVAQRVITKRETERLCRYAFELARSEGRKEITCVHKANILRETDGLFKRTFYEVAKLYPEFHVNDVLVDSCAFQLVKSPQKFDLLVTPNLYGDVLSDLIGGIVGSLGVLGSWNVGPGKVLFEPVHGAAPDIAGKGVSNPTGMIFASSFMLRHMGRVKEARAIERAVVTVMREGRFLTRDLGGWSSTQGFTDAITDQFETRLGID